MVARRGSPGNGGLSMKGPHPIPLATIKAHTPSTQPLSPLRNPGLGLRLMPIGRNELCPYIGSYSCEKNTLFTSV